jgi:hypothetical protein
MFYLEMLCVWVMPSIPNIVPLIVAGVIIGSILRKTDIRISWKLLILGSLLGGLGNFANAGLLFFFQGQQTRPSFSQRTPTDFQIPSNLQIPSTIQRTSNPISFLVTSFVVGAIMILIILIVAILTLRIRGRTTVDEQ